MNKEKFITRIIDNGLKKYLSGLEILMKNTIRLYFKSANEQSFPIGKSRIGGRPDLPIEISWPVEKLGSDSICNSSNQSTSLPLAFLAQINLSDTTNFDKDQLLPREGIIYFFYAANQDGYGFDCNDQNKFKVLYWNGEIDNLERKEFPADLPDFAYYDSFSITLESQISLPSIGHEFYDEFNMEEENIFWNEVYNETYANKILGYSDNIQGEMELQCELVTNGIYCGDSSAYTDPKAKELAKNANDWVLLLQLDRLNDDEALFGDSSRLYYWIKKNDLLNKRFDKSWVILQST